MKISKLIFTLVLIVLCGCDQRHFTAGKGDVGLFILRTAERFGDIQTATNALPHINDQWSYFEETNRVIIKLSNQAFPAVVKLLRQSFGQPSGIGDGYRYYEYELRTNGAVLDNGVYAGAILYLQEWDDYSEVIIQSHPEPNFSSIPPIKSSAPTAVYVFRSAGSVLF